MSSRPGAALAALFAFLLLWIWEPARYGLLAWMVPVALWGNLDRRARMWFVIPHAAVIIVAACIFPHLVATRALGAWTTAVAIGAVVAAGLPAKQRTGWRPALVLLATGALLTLALTPLRAGASEDFPPCAIFSRDSSTSAGVRRRRCSRTGCARCGRPTMRRWRPGR
jgi:hypothetical protein